MTETLTPRAGPRPATTATTPHRQVDQQPADPTIGQRLLAAASARWEHVDQRPSAISAPGARAWVLDPDAPAGPAEAFLVGTEFAHLHAPPDYSLHLTLPRALVHTAVSSGWAEPHPGVATGLVAPSVLLVYAPRDEGELDMVLSLLDQSYRFAISDPPHPQNPEGSNRKAPALLGWGSGRRGHMLGGHAGTQRHDRPR